MIVYKAENFSFSYKKSDKKALKNIKLEIGEGEFLGIIGKTGAGKTTLVLTMNGIIPNFLKGGFEGSVKIFGKDLISSKVNDFFRDVGIVFQDFETQIFSSSVEREIVFGLENLGIDRDEIKRRLEIFSKKMGIYHLLRRNPLSLSGGEKQRVVVASILAMEPSLLVFDEPTTDMDFEGREELYSLYNGLKGKKAIVVVEHELERLLSSDRVLILEKGEIVASGRPEEIFLNIDLFERFSIKPLEIPFLFKKLGSDEIPLTPEEGKEIFERKGYKILPSEEKGRPSSKIIELSDLSFSYGSNLVLKDINFEIREGELVSIIGPNGSGKSTLLKLIAGIFRPEKGKIFIKGKEIKELKGRINKIIGFGFQNPDYQIFKESVKEEVGFSLELSGIFGKEKEKRIEEILCLLGLLERRDDDPFTLSKGERQKLVVASILATEKEIIILDEPTTGLDPFEVDRVVEIIKALKRKGVTVIFVTHSLELAFSFSDWIIILKEGKIFEQGRPRELLSKKVMESVFSKLPSFLRFSQMVGGNFLSLEEAFERIIK